MAGELMAAVHDPWTAITALDTPVAVERSCEQVLAAEREHRYELERRITTLDPGGLTTTSDPDGW